MAQDNWDYEPDFPWILICIIIALAAFFLSGCDAKRFEIQTQEPVTVYVNMCTGETDVFERIFSRD